MSNDQTSLLERFAAAGILFTYSPNATVPEIPSFESVLHAVLPSDSRDLEYEFGFMNHILYCANVHLATAAVMDLIARNGEPVEDRDLDILIARVIVGLCPDEAKCLFVDEYVRALKVLERLPKSYVKRIEAGRTLTRDELIACCACPRCSGREFHRIRDAWAAS